MTHAHGHKHILYDLICAEHLALPLRLVRLVLKLHDLREEGHAASGRRSLRTKTLCPCHTHNAHAVDGTAHGSVPPTERTDLGKALVLDVTERVIVLRGYLTGGQSCFIIKPKHEGCKGAGSLLQSESATMPRMLCRFPGHSWIHFARSLAESWDFQQQVLREVQFSMISVLRDRIDALSQGKDTLNMMLISQHAPVWL
ncbi:unnamed protein product [Symbiodinium natans]|uniref:Uncharacterized protein n=1 Tax=Symbiodinium natans TaxID=878477 RepID=A0A812THV3_9DINO|nr:unnamed protein product [Symbiodinium natans]